MHVLFTNIVCDFTVTLHSHKFGMTDAFGLTMPKTKATGFFHCLWMSIVFLGNVSSLYSLGMPIGNLAQLLYWFAFLSLYQSRFIYYAFSNQLSLHHSQNLFVILSVPCSLQYLYLFMFSHRLSLLCYMFGYFVLFIL